MSGVLEILRQFSDQNISKPSSSAPINIAGHVAKSVSMEHQEPSSLISIKYITAVGAAFDGKGNLFPRDQTFIEKALTDGKCGLLLTDDFRITVLNPECGHVFLTKHFSGIQTDMLIVCGANGKELRRPSAEIEWSEAAKNSGARAIAVIYKLPEDETIKQIFNRGDYQIAYTPKPFCLKKSMFPFLLPKYKMYGFLSNKLG